MYSPLISDLIQSLRILPGVGPKSAQRMALHLLDEKREQAVELAENLRRAVELVTKCSSCRNLTEEETCAICKNPRRDDALLCVVESPADVLAIEQSGTFSGKYFVLHGKLSPIDGVGPKELGMEQLESKFASGIVTEVIVATNPSMEGEATAHYIAEKAKVHQVKVSRIAHGVPIGGELEYIDGGTLAHALSSRREI